MATPLTFVKNNPGGSTERVDVSDSNPFPVAVEIQAAIEDAKFKGTTDGGTTWTGVKAEADGTLHTKAPTLEDKLDSLITKVNGLDTKIAAIQNTTGIKRIADTVPVSLNDRSAVLNVPLSNVQIRDELPHSYTVDTTGYTKIFVYVLNSHNASFRFTFRPIVGMGNHVKAWNGATWVYTEEDFPGDSVCYFMNSKMPYLEDFAGTSFTFKIQALSLPTSGSIYVWVVGVKN